MKWFNLTQDEKQLALNRVNFCIIIYDIVSNKRRAQLSKLLEGYGVRVQKSCFEVKLEDAEYRSLMDDLHNFYNPEEMDNICVYKTKQTEFIRLSAYTEEPDNQWVYFF